MLETPLYINGVEKEVVNTMKYFHYRISLEIKEEMAHVEIM
jgi:hypothetical protein